MMSKISEKNTILNGKNEKSLKIIKKQSKKSENHEK